MYGCAVVVFAVFGYVDYLVVPETLPWSWLIRYGVCVPYLIFGYWASKQNWYGEWHNTIMLIGMLVITVMITAIGILASSPGRELYLATVCALPLVCGALRLRVSTTAAYVVATCFLLAAGAILFSIPLLTTGFILLDEISIGVIGLIGARIVEDGGRIAFAQEKAIAQEHDRAERLLLNILPRSVATRLKSGESNIADRLDEVSVLFADIVGFTRHSASLDAKQVVTELNDIFTAFDQLAEQYRVEKIKTIGDAYMAAAGLPMPRENHASTLVQMALAMLDVVKRIATTRGISLEIRIGVHSGPVVAGVIGQRKFSYDLWGDTVNTASRMESHGIPGKVQVTRTTYERIKENFLCEYRGVVNIKDLGETETWLVVGILGEGLQDTEK